MKINILYIFLFLLLGIAVFLFMGMADQGKTTVFGFTETEGQVLNVEHTAVVADVRVRTGDQVYTGDTLMILNRPELEEETTRKTVEIEVTAAEENVRERDIDLEIQKLRSASAEKIDDFKSQIQLLKEEDEKRAALRKMVDRRKQKSPNAQKIVRLEKAIDKEVKRFRAEFRELKKIQKAESTVFESKKNTAEKEIDMIEKRKEQLVLIAPMRGYIEEVFVFENQKTPQFSQLVKINPSRPNKVMGFLPESADVAYQLGDSVTVASFTRPEIKARAILIGNSKQMVELPMRLRKMKQVGAWGRELFIHLPFNNEFLIGEKTIIRFDSEEVAQKARKNKKPHHLVAKSNI